MKSFLSASSKGFSLVELAIVLVIVGIIVGVGVPLMSTLVTNIKYSQSRDIVQAAVDSVESWTAGNNQIPGTNFNTVVKNPNDAFNQPLIYVYDYNAANTTNLCGMKTTSLSITPVQGANAINNVAFAVFSHGGTNDNTWYSTATSNGGSTCANNTWIGNGYTTCTSGPPANPGTVSIIAYETTHNNLPSADIVQWVTMDELRTKAGCQGSELTILNNELPYGYNNTPYTATISANGGVAYLPANGKGQYEWCIENAQGQAFYNLSFVPTSTLGGTISFQKTGNCINNKGSWTQGDNIVISGSPVILVAYSNYVFLSILSNLNQTPPASCTNSAYWNCANQTAIPAYVASNTYTQGNLVTSSNLTFISLQSVPANQAPPVTCTSNAYWNCYPTWLGTNYYPSGSNTLTVYVMDNNGNGTVNNNVVASKNFTFTVNPM